jgi:hypothetical protein
MLKNLLVKTFIVPVLFLLTPAPTNWPLHGALLVDDQANEFGIANNPLSVTGTVTANQGAAGGVSGSWQMEVTDGTNVLGTASHPLRFDPTNTTHQTVDQGTAAAITAPWTGKMIDERIVLTNATIVGSASLASQVLTGLGTSEVTLIFKGHASTLQSISFTVQELDPQDQTTSVGTGSNCGTFQVIVSGDYTSTCTLSNVYGGTVKVTWVGDGVNNWTNSYLTLVSRFAGSTGQALDSSVTGLEVATNSTTSGQKGILGLTATTTNAPTYVTAKTNALSTTTFGALRSVLTDGTHNQPTMDAAARAGFVEVTDGTNTMPTMDSAARPGYFRQVAGTRSTYEAGIAAQTPASSATDVWCLVGNGTTTTRVLSISVNGTKTTASSVMFQLVKRTSANSGGASGAATAVSHDSTNSGANSAANSYTSNPSGLGSGTAFAPRFIFLPAPATATANTDAQPWTFGTPSGAQEMVLRGTAQALCINLNGVTVTGGSLNFNVVWTEE